MSSCATGHTNPSAVYPFDARGVAKGFLLAAILEALDALQLGETMRFCNDHDPIALLRQLGARYGDAVSVFSVAQYHLVNPMNKTNTQIEPVCE